MLRAASTTEGEDRRRRSGRRAAGALAAVLIAVLVLLGGGIAYVHQSAEAVRIGSFTLAGPRLQPTMILTQVIGPPPAGVHVPPRVAGARRLVFYSATAMGPNGSVPAGSVRTLVALERMVALGPVAPTAPLRPVIRSRPARRKPLQYYEARVFWRFGGFTFLGP